MSLEAAKAFVEKMKTDPAFSEEVSRYTEASERMTFVRKKGFDFSVSDLIQITEKMSDEDLSMISGGYWHQCLLGPKFH